mgnify:CR=1 FL=1
MLPKEKNLSLTIPLLKIVRVLGDKKKVLPRTPNKIMRPQGQDLHPLMMKLKLTEKNKIKIQLLEQIKQPLPPIKVQKLAMQYLILKLLMQPILLLKGKLVQALQSVVKLLTFQLPTLLPLQLPIRLPRLLILILLR